VSPIALSGAALFRASHYAQGKIRRPADCRGTEDEVSSVLRGASCEDGSPLCGIGVTSRIEVMVKQADCQLNATPIHDQSPAPLPSTSRVRITVLLRLIGGHHIDRHLAPHGR